MCVCLCVNSVREGRQRADSAASKLDNGFGLGGGGRKKLLIMQLSSM